MPLNIKNSKAHVYAKELAALTGKTITDAVTQALREALERARYIKDGSSERLTNKLDDIAVHCASLTVLDSRAPDDILGYNEIGVTE